jgi:hypothetical protein
MPNLSRAKKARLGNLSRVSRNTSHPPVASASILDAHSENPVSDPPDMSVEADIEDSEDEPHHGPPRSRHPRPRVAADPEHEAECEDTELPGPVEEEDERTRASTHRNISSFEEFMYKAQEIQAQQDERARSKKRPHHNTNNSDSTMKRWKRKRKELAAAGQPFVTK